MSAKPFDFPPSSNRRGKPPVLSSQALRQFRILSWRRQLRIVAALGLALGGCGADLFWVLAGKGVVWPLGMAGTVFALTYLLLRRRTT